MLCFWNNEVFQNTEGVLQAIFDALTAALTPAEAIALTTAEAGALTHALSRLNVTHKMIVKNYKYSKLKEIHKAEEKAINGRTGLSN